MHGSIAVQTAILLLPSLVVAVNTGRATPDGASATFDLVIALTIEADGSAFNSS